MEDLNEKQTEMVVEEEKPKQEETIENIEEEKSKEQEETKPKEQEVDLEKSNTVLDLSENNLSKSELLETVPDDTPDENLQNFFVPDEENKPNLIQNSEMNLEPVKGNSKVKRCPICNTFVSINKPHSQAECQSRLAKFKANKGKKGTKKECKNKKQVNRLLKKVKTLAKKYGTKTMQKKYNFPAPIRNFFSCYA